MGVTSGVLVSLWIYLIMSANTMARNKENLVNMCDERARMLQDQFNVSMNHVHALAILVSTFHHGKRPSAIDQVFFIFFLQIQRFILSFIASSRHFQYFTLIFPKGCGMLLFLSVRYYWFENLIFLIF